MTKKDHYPEVYVQILEDTTDELRYQIRLAEVFYQSNSSDNPQEYIKLIKTYTDEVAKDQETIDGVELYLPFHIGLYLLTRYSQPNVVFETGVERGGSTLSILIGLYKNKYGKLHSFDISNSTRFVYKNEEWQKGKDAKSTKDENVFVPIGTLVPTWLKNRWKFIVGSSIKNVPRELKQITALNFFVAGHSHTYEIQKAETENIWDSLESGGILVIDRSDWEDNKWFNELVHKQGIEPENYVICKESKYSLKFNYVIVIKQ